MRFCNKKKKEDESTLSRNRYQMSAMEVEVRTRQHSIQQDGFKLFPVGSELQYIGLSLNVVAHIPYSYGNYGLCDPSRIRCEYVNKQGEILTKDFTCEFILKWQSSNRWHKVGQ